MNKLMTAILLLLFCPMALGSGLAGGQTPAPACIEPPHWHVLMQELRGLRIELLQDRVLRTDARIAELQQQLHQTEADKGAVNDMEQSQAEEIADFEHQLARPGLSSQERAELEKNRFLLVTTGPTQLAELRSGAAFREAELRRQLGIQQQYRQQLEGVLNALASPSPAN